MPDLHIIFNYFLSYLAKRSIARFLHKFIISIGWIPKPSVWEWLHFFHWQFNCKFFFTLLQFRLLKFLCARCCHSYHFVGTRFALAYRTSSVRNFASWNFTLRKIFYSVSKTFCFFPLRPILLTQVHFVPLVAKFRKKKRTF